MLNQQYQVLHPDSYIEPLLVRVQSNNRLGVCNGIIGTDSMSSSCGKNKGDRFKLSIPYARQTLIWNVFFDSQCPEMGPDFIFNDDTFLANMDIDILSTKIPSLAKWNPNNKDALLNVLMELLVCYKDHQIQLLHKQEVLKREYTMLMKTDIRLEDVETLLLPLGSKPTEARFLISLSVDLSQLQNRTCESENAVAILHVTYSGTNWDRIMTQLYLTKPLEDVLGNTQLLLPHFPRNKFLMDYITEVRKCISEKINVLVHSFEQRCAFMSVMATNQYLNLCEYDAVNFTYMCYLYGEDDFWLYILITLTLNFPKEKPIVTLQSVYHMREQGVPYTEQIYFPYSCNWNPLKMINRLMNHIHYKALEEFKANSIKICS
ncbi:BRISC and BRCA1-A complex member 2-like isoform X1 [Hylaeus volcanicus]|uniref:BRISC and BRCA1-A complex member 2-like isoform X1 n=1 Tax=Hylaeus volcanicus TaxID=313075 RepID=UPI0023B81560|nr:BRISC and BRCA1-A complex member 2-like isoform X1 [Hylaeus volcanicus]